jgi:HSP20 family protein
MSRKPSFFERLTGNVRADDEENIDEEEENDEDETNQDTPETDGQLSVDMYQTDKTIVIKAMIAGVRIDDLDIDISREMVVIKGRREEAEGIAHGDYFFQELYWGSFIRTLSLPEEIEVEEAEASEKHGLLTITLPKIDKTKKSKLKVKSVS